jgi:hypothetical protein
MNIYRRERKEKKKKRAPVLKSCAAFFRDVFECYSMHYFSNDVATEKIDKNFFFYTVSIFTFNFYQRKKKEEKNLFFYSQNIFSLLSYCHKLLNNEQFIKVRIASIRHHHRVARFNVYLS